MKARMLVLVIAIQSAIIIGGAIDWWSPSPSLPDSVIHNPLTKNLQPKPRKVVQGDVGPRPAPAPPMPPAATGTPPQEAWLPRELSAQEKVLRAATDQMHMKMLVLRAGTIPNV